MTAVPRMEVRYGLPHNLSIAVVAVALIGGAILHFTTHPDNAPALSLNDPRFVLIVLVGLAMGYYVYLGLSRSIGRDPQVVIDDDGIALGFGRNRRIAWRDIEWVRLRRLSLRPQLEIGLEPQAFLAANLRLSMWNFDDGLRPVRGVPTALLVRDNGLDTSASAMLDAVRTLRPNLIKP